MVNSLNDLNIHVGSLLDYTIPYDIFEDKENNTLYFTASIVNLITNQISDLPSWLKFDRNTRRFYGIPEKIDINNHTI